jgi:hypothetical protein
MGDRETLLSQNLCHIGAWLDETWPVIAPSELDLKSSQNVLNGMLPRNGRREVLIGYYSGVVLSISRRTTSLTKKHRTWYR